MGGCLFFLRLQGRCFSKSAWGYTPAPRLPEAFRLPPNSQPPSVSHGQMMGRFPLLCPALFSLPIFFFSECTSTQVRMAELPGNSQKPLAFGTICPAAFLLLLIRKKWGWMQSTSSPLNVMRLCKLGLLSSFFFFFSFFLCLFLFSPFICFISLFFLALYYLCSVLMRFAYNYKTFTQKSWVGFEVTRLICVNMRHNTKLKERERSRKPRSPVSPLQARARGSKHAR